MKKINATIVADSIDTHNNRITTFILTYPRFIHSELMTHRVFSRNSASSRAIPFEKMVKMVEEDPFIPIAWQKEHRGMQGSEYFTKEDDIQGAIDEWLESRDGQIANAKQLNKQGVTKQLCNRLLEPFMWHTVLVTATEYDNFFELRCPKYQTPVSQSVEPQKSWKDLTEVHSNPENLKRLEANKDNWVFKMQHSLSAAEIHIQALAEAMWDAKNESTPKQLQAGEWHIPFGNQIDISKLDNYYRIHIKKVRETFAKLIYDRNLYKIKIATARCARLSYMTFDGEIDYEKDIQLHDRLLVDWHMSPFEHCARVMNDAEYESFYKGQIGLGGESGWCNNFRGFIPYRYIIENKEYENSLYIS